MRTAGVGLDHLLIDEDTPTGRAIIQVDSDGENSIVILAGCNGLEVDLPAQVVRLADGSELPFDVDPFRKGASDSSTRAY